MQCFQVSKLHPMLKYLSDVKCWAMLTVEKGPLSSFTDGKKVGWKETVLACFFFLFFSSSSWLTFLVLLSVQTLESINKRQAACQHARPQYFNCTFHILHSSKWKKAAKMLNWRRNKKKKETSYLAWKPWHCTFRKPPFFFLSPTTKKLGWFFGVKYCARVHSLE